MCPCAWGMCSFATLYLSYLWSTNYEPWTVNHELWTIYDLLFAINYELRTIYDSPAMFHLYAIYDIRHTRYYLNYTRTALAVKEKIATKKHKKMQRKF